MRARVCGAALAVVVLAACGSNDQRGAPGAPLAPEYVAIEVTAGGDPRPLLPGTEVVVGFAGDRLTAELGCGRLTGRWSFERTRLVLEDVEQPTADCDPARAEQARSLGEFVTSRPQMLVSGDEAVINDGFTTIVLRDRTVTPPDEPLLRTTWIHPAGPTRLVFEVDGTITGTDPCGDLAGGPDPLRYDLDGDQLEVSGEAPSRCADPAAAPLRATLAGALTWSVDADVLTLTSPDGAATTLRAAAG